MVSATDLDLSDRASFETRQENTSKAISDCRAKASFERLCIELAIGSRQRFRFTVYDATVPRQCGKLWSVVVVLGPGIAFFRQPRQDRFERWMPATMSRMPETTRQVQCVSGLALPKERRRWQVRFE